MEEIRYRRVRDFIEAARTLREDDEYDLMECSDPTRRIIGFIDHTAEQYHIIGITDVKATIGDLSDMERERLTTPKGRQQLLEEGY